MAVHSISLSGYSAHTTTGGPLRLGTWDSYGIEQLQINPGPEWMGLVITATFSNKGSALAPPIVIPSSGTIDVPPGATAQALSIGNPGVIVFSGVSDGVQRISTNIYYTVVDHGPTTGTAPQPTPDQWAQLIKKYQEMLNAAVPPNGTPGYVLGATENGNAWVPQAGGGGGGSGGTITNEDTGTVYDAALHIRGGYPVLILTERSADNG